MAGERPQDHVGGSPAARRALDRDTIVAVGLAFIDEHGLASLSMRRLGARLGVEGMALYHYVPGKEALLDAIVDAMIEQVRADPDVPDAPTHGWQDFLQRLAHGLRRLTLAHPVAFPLLAARPPEAPWLRPPLRNIEWVETILGGLVDEGFDDATAVAAYRAFTSFLLGHLLLEAANHGADIGPLDMLDDGQVRAGIAGHPHLERMSAALAQDHAAAEFDESLENLLDRIDQLRAEQSHDPR